jgi:hypothetical protein
MFIIYKHLSVHIFYPKETKGDKVINILQVHLMSYANYSLISNLPAVRALGKFENIRRWYNFEKKKIISL